MKVIRHNIMVAVLVGLGIVGTICIIQQSQINDLKETRRRLIGENLELSSNYAAQVAMNEARDAELASLRNEATDIPALRIQLAQAQNQARAATFENNAASQTESVTAYLRREQLKFAGFNSPEDAFQSLQWARINRDYTNWFAALGPEFQNEELADPRSMEKFLEGAASYPFLGMQVLGQKAISHDKVELKVRLDAESGVVLFIYPMTATGNEWRLGDDIRSYSREWDLPSNAQ